MKFRYIINGPDDNALSILQEVTGDVMGERVIWMNKNSTSKTQKQTWDNGQVSVSAVTTSKVKLIYD